MSAPELEWGFYVVDQDRSWGWSNHVCTLGCVCLGYGETPEAGWAEAMGLAAYRVASTSPSRRRRNPDRGRARRRRLTRQLCDPAPRGSAQQSVRAITRVGGRLRFPHGLADWLPDPSRRRIEPCVRFSRTRLSDILHRRACAVP